MLFSLMSLTAAFFCAPETSRPAHAQPQLSDLERSYWVHASLGWKPHRGYWGIDLPACSPPTEPEVRNAAQLLTRQYAANRLYLVYHKEITMLQAEQVFKWWRQHVPNEIEIVPTLVMRTYDKSQTEVFATNELRGLCAFFRQEVGS